jgi:16S rRNA processing protein RimM
LRAKNSLVELGFVSGVFGVRGEVRLHLHNRDTSLLRGDCEVLLLGPEGQQRLVQMRTRSGAGKRVLARIEGVKDRVEAAALKGWRLAVDEQELPVLSGSEFYVRDLQGARVQLDGAHLGEVVAVHHSGGIDILEIRIEDANVFLPCRQELIDTIDVEHKLVVLCAAAGELL